LYSLQKIEVHETSEKWVVGKKRCRARETGNHFGKKNHVEDYFLKRFRAENQSKKWEKGTGGGTMGRTLGRGNVVKRATHHPFSGREEKKKPTVSGE